MDRPALRKVLEEMVEETTGEPCPPIEEGTDLKEGLGLDSVDLFSLVVEAQARFGIKISSDDLDQVSKVSQFLDVLEKKLGGGGATTTTQAA